MEMYNNTITDKIKKEKQIINIQQSVTAPKVSDVFLASSELARFKKKSDSPGIIAKSLCFLKFYRKNHARIAIRQEFTNRDYASCSKGS